jgi:peptidoglycan/LPS O-acetylase OafA/YrhL
MVALEKPSQADHVAGVAAVGEARRIVALDGLRGLMTVFVVISHFFAELPGGLNALMFGWVGVDMFFVLSGFLVGKLILEKSPHANFFSVFYVRRFLRTVPAYLVTVLVVFALLRFCDPAWSDADGALPLWSYLTFTQSFLMVSRETIGAHWLAPTWTLAVEEHFYLIVPALIVFTPRRWLVATLSGVVVGVLILRFAIYQGGFASPIAALVLLPGRADLLAFGILAAIAVTRHGFLRVRFDLALRIVPLAALISILVMQAFGGTLFEVYGSLAMSIGCASYLLSIVRGAPEAKRLESRWLQFLGNNSYCIYLTHLPVLGLMHGLILGGRPALTSPAQWMVTLVATPVCILVGWAMTKAIEEPLTRYGRSWRWSPQTRVGSGVTCGHSSQGDVAGS